MNYNLLTISGAQIIAAQLQLRIDRDNGVTSPFIIKVVARAVEDETLQSAINRFQMEIVK